MKTRMLMFTMLFLGLVVFNTSGPFAGTTGKIVGKVVDAQSGETLPGVNVVLEGTMMGAATDLDGEYLILHVPPGTYTIRAKMMGFSDTRIENIKVSIDLTTTRNVRLNSEVLDLGEEVTIIAQREVIQKDMTSSLASIGADEIQAMPVQEVADVLELQAGLVRDASGGLHVRGGRSSEVAYWVDGIAVTDVFNGDMGVEIENASVQELQVISGTFNAEYGQAMSGIVNIVTKEGGPQYTGEISGYVGDYLPSDGDREFGVYKPLLPDISAIRSPHADSVELINPLDDFNAILNASASLSGPVPLIKDLSFFSTFRYYSTEGHLYGLRWFTPQGQKGDEELVPMAPFRKFSGQAKLAYHLTNSIKLTYNIVGNDNQTKYYDRYFKYNPDGDYQRFEKSLTHIWGMTHTLSATTFYELKVSRFSNEYKEYVYEDPLKPVEYSPVVVEGDTIWQVTSTDTYVHADSNNFSPAPWSFQDGGMKMDHYQRKTQYTVGKLDLTSQITKRHQVKFGFETRFHDLSVTEFDVLNVDETERFQPKLPVKDDVNNYTTFQNKPIEISGYLQDKMEYKDMIVNLGLRFDYFMPDADVFVEKKQTNIYDPEFQPASKKYQVSPRFGIAYPITDRGVIHFSYGHFFQMPSFNQLYGPLVLQETTSNAFLNNPDLKPQKTVMYEIGLQQQFSDDIGMDLTLFYRDIRDWIGTRHSIATNIPSLLYSQRINKDYSNVRGITLAVNKRYSNYVEGSLDYTYMVAEGSASNPDDEYHDHLNNRAPRIQLNPLSWDQRHTFNGHISVGTSEWRASLLGRFWTGMPYTPSFTAVDVAGESAFIGLRENSARRPNMVTFDLKLHKQIIVGKLRYTFFAYIYNILDLRGQTSVYSDTGDANYTLDTKNAGTPSNRVSLLDDNVVHPEWYSEPRKIQVGFSLGF